MQRLLCVRRGILKGARNLKPKSIHYLFRPMVECACRHPQMHRPLGKSKPVVFQWLVLVRQGENPGLSLPPKSGGMNSHRRRQYWSAGLCKNANPP